MLFYICHISSYIRTDIGMGRQNTIKGKNNKYRSRLKQIFNLFVNLRNHKIYSCNDQRDITSIELGAKRDETINM